MPDRPEAAVPKARAARLEHIDSLRGVACLLVVYIHAVQWLERNAFPMSGLEATLLHESITRIDPGKVGVLVFFAISGYVVPFSLRRPLAHPLREFVGNRFFRLMPAYWFSLVAGVLLIAWFEQRPTDLAGWLGNLVLAPQLLGREPLLDVYWTLQVELVFYVACAGLAALGLIHLRHLAGWLAMLGLAGALAAAAIKHFLLIDLPVGLALWLALMFWGFAAREADISGDRLVARQVQLLFWAFLLALGPICYLGYDRLPSVYGTWQSYFWSYVLAVLIFWAFAIRWPWSAGWLTWVGRISYSVYLLHVLCIIVLGAWLGPWLAGQVPGVVFIGLVGLASVAVSALTFGWLERPAIGVGRELNRRWRTAPDGRLRQRPLL
ncbi:MAG: acyltransferase [Geminicoccaceae bacterium]